MPRHWMITLLVLGVSMPAGATEYRASAPMQAGQPQDAIIVETEGTTAPAAETEQPPTRFESTNIVIGACERYVPLDVFVQMNAAVAKSTPEMRQQVAKWREQGREMGRVERFDYRICSALLRDALR